MKKTVSKIGMVAVLLVSSVTFADQFGIRPGSGFQGRGPGRGDHRGPGAGPNSPQQQLTLSLVGQSRNGTYENTSGGTVQLVRNDSIRLRAEVRDQRGNIVNIPPVRIRQNFFNNIQVSINFNGELEIQTTNRPSLSTDYLTVEAQVGFRTQSIQIGIQVIKPSFPGFSKYEALDMSAKLYRAVLLREADQGGLELHARVIQREAGVRGVVNAAQGMVSSQEFLTVTRAQHSSVEIVKSIYRNLLNREVDPSGLSFYAGMVDRGQTADVLRQIITSEEFMSIVNP